MPRRQILGRRVLQPQPVRVRLRRQGCVSIRWLRALHQAQCGIRTIGPIVELEPLPLRERLVLRFSDEFRGLFADRTVDHLDELIDLVDERDFRIDGKQRQAEKTFERLKGQSDEKGIHRV